MKWDMYKSLNFHVRKMTLFQKSLLKSLFDMIIGNTFNIFNI